MFFHVEVLFSPVAVLNTLKLEGRIIRGSDKPFHLLIKHITCLINVLIALLCIMPFLYLCIIRDDILITSISEVFSLKIREFV